MEANTKGRVFDMIRVRQNTFETNSSSTHSITMCMESDYMKWKNGELFLTSDGKFVTEEGKNSIIRRKTFENKLDIDYGNKTITYENKVIPYTDWQDRRDKVDALCTPENLAKITEDDINEYLEACSYDIGVLSYESYWDKTDEYETYKEDFTTPNGEKVVAFVYYGNDY